MASLPAGWVKKTSATWSEEYYVCQDTSESMWVIPSWVTGNGKSAEDMLKEVGAASSSSTAPGARRVIPLAVQNKMKDMQHNGLLKREHADAPVLQRALTIIPAQEAVQVLEDYEDITHHCFRCSDALQKPVDFLVSMVADKRRRLDGAVAASQTPKASTSTTTSTTAPPPPSSSSSSSGGKSQEQQEEEICAKLPSDMQAIFKKNPHIRQVFLGDKSLVHVGRKISEVDRYAFGETPRTKYQRRKGEAKTVIQWDQRRALIAEMTFLLDKLPSADFDNEEEEMDPYGVGTEGKDYSLPSNPLVIYYVDEKKAAADAKIRIDILANHLFSGTQENIEWILIDGSDDPDTSKPSSSKISYRTDHFSLALAAEFAKRRNVYFICLPRDWEEAATAGTAATAASDSNNKNTICQHHMSNIGEWHSAMNPRASLFSFRLPYPPPSASTSFLDGKLMFPVWGGATQTHSYLSVDGDEAGGSGKWRNYDHVDYEDLFFHFNSITRTCFWELPEEEKEEGEEEGAVKGTKGMVIEYDHCFDCAAEVYSLQQVAERKEKKGGEKMSVLSLTKIINAAIGVLPPQGWKK